MASEQPPRPVAQWPHRLWRLGEFVAHFVATWALRVGLPLVSVAVMLRAFPYRGTIAGVPIRVQGSLFTRPGLTADTTFGNWEFPKVDGLPIGVHVSAVNVDVLALNGGRTPDRTFIEHLRASFADRVPWIALWLVVDVLIGFALGLAMAAAINMAFRYLRAVPRREHEFRYRGRQAAAACAMLVLISGYGALTYEPDWTRQSRLTGTLGAVQLFPSQLEKFYNQQSKVYDVLGAVVGIQAQLQAQIEEHRTPDTAYNIMFISDVHLAAVYPLVAQYVENFDVKLIVNTGDESEFGTRVELTPSFRASIAAITRTTPMLWLAGNHDSPEVEQVMRAIPGVTVLGAKTRLPDGSFTVTGSGVAAFGLTIAGAPDPRVYGAPGAAGADVDQVTDPLEKAGMASVAESAGERTRFDIFATHAPVAADELVSLLAGRIRQVNAGHTHAQNSSSDITKGQVLRLVEGSTGAGGLDNLNRETEQPPIEFTIESVSMGCQFTRLQRFQVADPAATLDPSRVAQRGDVTVSTIYLAPQDISGIRYCSTSLGVSQPRSLDVFGPADAR